MSCGRHSPLSSGQCKGHIHSSRGCRLCRKQSLGSVGSLRSALQTPAVQMKGLIGMFTETGLSKRSSWGKMNGGCFHIVNWLQAYLKIMDSLTIWIKVTQTHFPTRCGGITCWYGFANLWATNAYSPMNMPHLCLEKYQCKRWQILWLENMLCVSFSLEVLVEIVIDSNAV